MDDKFLPSQAAIISDNAEELERLVRADPSLARDRSLSLDHSTLLQCLVLETPARRSLGHLIRLLAQFGAKLNEPLVDSASRNNLLAVEVLLHLGASISGEGKWSPLEEALYWGHLSIVGLLLKRGAPVDNLRKFAAFGDLQGLRRCFNDDGSLNRQAGEVAWPFGPTIPEEVVHDRLQIMNNALVYAAAWGQIESAGKLLSRGAEINSIPARFDYAGTPLHYASIQNRHEMVEWLLEYGADPTIRDTKVHATPVGWAEYVHHPQLAVYIRGKKGNF